MKRTYSLFVIFMFWTVLGWASSDAFANQSINDAADKFINSVKTSNVLAFKSLIAPNGILVVRNFVSGGYGVRGKNVRDLYNKNNIPKDLRFAVRKEVPINISDMFAETLKGDSHMIRLIELNSTRYSTFETKMATAAMVRMLANILRESKANDSEPVLIGLEGNGFVLAEAQLIDNNPNGTFAIFTRKQERYYLEALVDLR